MIRKFGYILLGIYLLGSALLLGIGYLLYINGIRLDG